jgi:two-component system, LytTR family, sensor kinase
MLLPVLLKLLFGVLMVLVIIPRFARKRQPGRLVLEIVLATLMFLLLERFAGVVFNAAHLHEHGHNFFNSIWFHLIIYILISCICMAWFFAKEWVRNEKLKRELIETQLTTELNFLKSQINPHFLFNTLNNLFSIAQHSENEQLATGIHKLSGLMRYVIYDSNATKVPLHKEIGYITDFIELSKLRFTKEELTVNFIVEGPVQQLTIAPMILVPFVENAFKHGVKIESPSFINILVTGSSDTIIFECVNRVYAINRHAQDDYAGIGLENVKRRLELIYPGKHTLAITMNNGIYKVQLELTT